MASIESVAPISSTEYLVSETESSGSALAVPDDDQPVSNTDNIEDEDTEGWVLPENGLCDFIPIKQLSNIEALVCNDTQRLFRGIYRQPETKADLCLTWGESKGAGLVVWSYFIGKKKYVILPSGEIVKSKPKGTKFDQRTGRVKYRAILPTERTMDLELHVQMGRNIRKACGKASGRLRALGFTRVVEDELTYQEMSWQMRQELTHDASAELTTFRTSVPH